MTANAFRTLALSMPAATEGSHMDNANFRVSVTPGSSNNKSRGKIFATLPFATLSFADDDSLAMVKLAPDDQQAFMTKTPTAFYPASGGCGRQGCTMVTLKLVSKPPMKRAITAAWRCAAPKSLLDKHAPRRPRS